MALYLMKSGVTSGPYTMEETRRLVASGTVSPENLARSSGDADWRPLSELLDLSAPLSSASSASARGEGSPLPDGDGPRGVGGWLLFFCVGLTILIPLKNLWHTTQGFKLAWPAFQEFPALRSVVLWEALGMSVIILYGFVVGCKIWSGNPQGRALARRYLLFSLMGFIAIEVVAIFLLRSLPTAMVSAGISGVTKELFNQGIYFTVWWLYFKYSKRVRHTYASS